MLLLWLLGLYVVSAALSFAQHFIMTGVSQKLSYSLRGRLAAKVHRLPMSYFDRVTYGDVLSRVTNDVDTLGQSLNQSLSQVVTSLSTAVGVAVMMLSISWQMTLAALLILPLSGILMGLVVRKSQKYFVGQQRYMGELNGQVEEMYAGHVVVKAFGAQESAERAFAGVNEKLYRSAWKSQFLSGLMQPITTLIGNLGYVAAVVLGSGYAAAGVISVGDIQSFIQYVRSFNQPVSQIAQIFNILQSAMAAAERVFEFLDEAEEEPAPVHPAPPASAARSPSTTCASATRPTRSSSTISARTSYRGRRSPSSAPRAAERLPLSTFSCGFTTRTGAKSFSTGSIPRK